MIISGFGIVCNFWTVGTLPLSPHKKKLDKLQIFKMSGIGLQKVVSGPRGDQTQDNPTDFLTKRFDKICSQLQ